MISNSLLWNPWRGRAATSVRPARPRRSWHLDLALGPISAPPGDDEGADADGSWHASSHELASGLQVTEHHVSPEELGRWVS